MSFLDYWKHRAPWCGNASPVATWSYAIYSKAAERFALANNQESTDDMRGRAWRVGAKVATASLACAPEHFYRKPTLSFWEKLGTAMRQVKAFLGNSNDFLLEQPMLTSGGSCSRLSEMYRFDPPIKQEVFSAKVHAFDDSHFAFGKMAFAIH